MQLFNYPTFLATDSIAKSSPLTLYVSVGSEGLLLSVNRRAVQLLGYQREELLGRPLLSFFAGTPASQARAEEAFPELREGSARISADLDPLLVGPQRVHKFQTVFINLGGWRLRDRLLWWVQWNSNLRPAD